MGKAHILEGCDPTDDGQLIDAVIAVFRVGIDPRRGQQPDLVIVAQHPYADSG